MGGCENWRQLQAVDLRSSRTELKASFPGALDKINEQIGYEFAASIQYTAIAWVFDVESLPYRARP
jgi:hypothetical protein